MWWLIPLFSKKKKIAKKKLDNFYNIAYAFVKIREDFSVKINNKIHNKENCGYFHSFNFSDITASSKTYTPENNLISITEFDSKQTGLIFSELKFFDYVAEKFKDIDEDLRDVFIEYFKARGPINVQNRLGCEDGTLIKLRKQIEEKITLQYHQYKKQAQD